MLGLGSAELHSSVDRELWRANVRLAFTTFACVSWVKILSREAERDSRGELKGEDSAEEQVSLSPPLKYLYGFMWDVLQSAGLR